MTGETDPYNIYGIFYNIEAYKLCTQYQLDEVCKLNYSKSERDNKEQYLLGGVVDTYNKRLT